MLKLEDARRAVRIKNTEFDTELTALIEAGKEDMKTAGVAEQEDSKLYDAALRMYILAHWEPDAPEAEKARSVYEGIKETMHLHSRYRMQEDDEFYDA